MLVNKSPDVTLRNSLLTNGWSPDSPEAEMTEIYDIDFEFGVPPALISTKYIAEYTTEEWGDDLITINANGGYRDIIQGMADEVFQDNDTSPRLDTVVTEIHQNDSHVTVHTQSGDVFTAEHLILTVSLGVLQHKLITFQPDLPTWKWDSIFGFQMAYYFHFYLRFPETFWDSTEYILLAREIRGDFSLWQNFNKFWPGSHILQCTLTHDLALRWERATDQEIVDKAMEVLKEAYGDSIPSPIASEIPRIGIDPLFMGSFSVWPTGYSMESFLSLRAAVDRVHFAGEHTSEKYHGYLHGAMFEGERAAEEVANCLDGDCTVEYVPSYEARGCMYSTARNYDENAQLDDGSCVFVVTSAGNLVQHPSVGLLIMLVAVFCMY